MRRLGLCRRKRVMAVSEAGYFAKYLRVSKDDDDIGVSKRDSLKVSGCVWRLL